MKEDEIGLELFEFDVRLIVPMIFLLEMILRTIGDGMELFQLERVVSELRGLRIFVHAILASTRD